MKSLSTTKAKLIVYKGFSGLDTSGSDISMEMPDRQPLVHVDNVFCSTDGYISTEYPLEKVDNVHDHVFHIRHYSLKPNAIVYAARMAGYTELRVLDKPNTPVQRLDRTRVLTSCIFNKRVIVASGGDEPLRRFDGYSWLEIDKEGATGAAYCTTVSNRLVLAGFRQNTTEVIVSRVNDETMLAADEEDGDPSVLKAFRFNIANLLGQAEEIRGLASFENDKLVIFTNERVLIYSAPVDATSWALQSNVKVSVGTISHNTICASKDDIVFCARDGVYSLKRSAQNGLTVFQYTMSDKVESLYKGLLAKVKDAQSINAVFDKDRDRYVIFFPVNDVVSYRLSMHVGAPDAEGAVSDGLWAQSSFAGLVCADALGGRLVAGAVDGIVEIKDEDDELNRGPGMAEFPILWHGDLLEPKQSHSMMLLAAGEGRVIVSATDETGRDLGSVFFDVNSPDRADYPGVPLPRQFERPFQHTYTGLKLKLSIEDGSTRVRIYAIGIRRRET